MSQLEPWQIPELRDEDRITDRPSGEDRRRYNPINRLVAEIRHLEEQNSELLEAAKHWFHQYQQVAQRSGSWILVGLLLGFVSGLFWRGAWDLVKLTVGLIP